MTGTLFFAFGSVAFWVLASVALLLMFAALDKDSWAGALVTIVAFSVLFVLFGEGVEAGKWLIKNPKYIAGGLGIYVLAGSVWGVGRWWLEVRKLARNTKEVYIQHRKNFLKRNQDELGPGVLVTDATNIPPHLTPKWNEETINYRHWKLATENGKIIPPQASDYKPQILTWMGFWPFSLIWTVLDDFVKELYENIYQFLATWLQQISDKAFADILKQQEADSLEQQQEADHTNESV